MISNQHSGGFLPPLTTLFTNKHQPPSSFTTTNPNHLPGYITLPIPQPSQTTTKPTTQQPELAAAIHRALVNIRNALVAAATRPTTVKNPICRTKSDITHQKRPTTRHPLRRTVSDTVTLPITRKRKRKIGSYLSLRHNATEGLDRDESPKTKRLKKMEEMVMEIKERCKDVMCEAEVQENVGDENKPDQETVVPGEGGEECVGFKRLEGEEECIEFKRLDDGALRIKMCCSCRKHFEILHNDIGCFYRLI